MTWVMLLQKQHMTSPSKHVLVVLIISKRSARENHKQLWIEDSDVHDKQNSPFLVKVIYLQSKVSKLVYTISLYHCIILYALFRLYEIPMLRTWDRLLVRLLNAQKNSFLTSYLVKDISLVTGGNVYPWDVTVSDIANNLLLGLDFLRAEKAKIDLVQDYSLEQRGMPSGVKEGLIE